MPSQPKERRRAVQNRTSMRAGGTGKTCRRWFWPYTGHMRTMLTPITGRTEERILETSPSSVSLTVGGESLGRGGGGRSAGPGEWSRRDVKKRAQVTNSDLDLTHRGGSPLEKKEKGGGKEPFLNVRFFSATGFLSLRRRGDTRDGARVRNLFSRRNQSRRPKTTGEVTAFVSGSGQAPGLFILQSTLLHTRTSPKCEGRKIVY